MELHMLVDKTTIIASLLSKSLMHNLIINSHFGSVSCWQPASQELRQRKAASTSWRGPIWASAPLGLRRGAGANPIGVVVVVALVVVAHFAPRPPGACDWRCHLLSITP